jgi:hypothetical protein
LGVAVDDRALLEAEVRDGEAVGQADAVGPRDPQSASRSAARFVTCRPRSSMPRTQREDHDGLLGRAQDDRVQRLAHLRRVLLGVVERRQRPALGERQRFDVEQDRRRDQRAGQAAAPGLVGARDVPEAQLAVELEEPASRSLAPCRSHFSPRQSGSAAPRLEESDLLGRPVGGEGSADDPFPGNGSPEPAVVGAPRLSPIMK